MIHISVKHNIQQVQREIVNIAREQIPFATAKALTETAKQGAKDVTDELEKVFQKPAPFTKRGIGFSSASKRSLMSKVFIKDKQAQYLGIQITGGRRLPKRRAIALPINQKLNQYGNLPRNKIKQLLSRKDVFSGKIGGVGGIWQRTKRGMKLLIAWAPQAQYKPRFPFAAIVEQSVSRRFNANFLTAYAQAVATRR